MDLKLFFYEQRTPTTAQSNIKEMLKRLRTSTSAALKIISHSNNFLVLTMEWEKEQNHHQLFLHPTFHDFFYFSSSKLVFVHI